MASGVKVADETFEMYKAMKLKRLNCRYVMLAIDLVDGCIKPTLMKEKDNSISQEEEFKEFLKNLPLDVGRYCIIDLTIPQKNGALKDIMFIITWCPTGAPTKSHMLYATSKKAMMDKMREGMIDIQANDLSDLNYDELLGKGCK